MFRLNIITFNKLISFIRWLKDNEYTITNYMHINKNTTLINFKQQFFNTVTDKISVKTLSSPHFSNFSGPFTFGTLLNNKLKIKPQD